MPAIATRDTRSLISLGAANATPQLGLSSYRRHQYVGIDASCWWRSWPRPSLALHNYPQSENAMNALHLKCQTLFDGTGLQTRQQQTLVVENGLLTYVGPTAMAPQPQAGDSVVDAGDNFVMPGLVDVHTHLAFGNAWVIFFNQGPAAFLLKCQEFGSCSCGGHGTTLCR